jgi:hypothetical protein
VRNLVDAKEERTMDGMRFDFLAKGLTTDPSRRNVIRRLGMLVLGVPLGLGGPSKTAAKKKKGRKKKRRTGAGSPPLPPQCVPACNGKTCGIDGCGGSCGSCTLPNVCQNGICTIVTCGGIAGTPCPAGFECIDDPRDDCNPPVDADCPGLCVPTG